MEWIDGNRIKIIPPHKPKKLTATRFATILGLNPWSTPFEVWCEVTRTYQKPFEDTIYTIAGKTIEPKQAQYMKDQYLMTGLITPTDIWGENYFKKTWGDFFPEQEVLGGMWDYLLYKDGKPVKVFEMKTTKRVEDWEEDIPEYYALQAALYAYLLGIDDVIMVASFLDDADYDHPENFVCSGKNTITRPFKVSERYPDFEKKYVKPALKWWKDHVISGISPIYDEKKDADILKALRTNNLSPETDLDALVKEAESLKQHIDAVTAGIKEDEDRYKKVVAMIKEKAIEQFRDGDKSIVIPGQSYRWEVTRKTTMKVDKKAMEKDGVLDKYVKAEESFAITPREPKEDK